MNENVLGVEEGLEQPRASGVRVEIDTDGTVGYVSIQNSVPIVRSIRVSNDSSETLEGVRVLVSTTPAFATGLKLRFDRLAAGESRCITPIDLAPDHGFLAALTESMNASVMATVSVASGDLAQVAAPIEVLAYDQWAGTRALPELLAAFSMPNNPSIDVLVGKASRLLRSEHSELSMSGYQSKSRDQVWKQVSAIYSTLAAESLQYAEPPASFGTDGQKIRTPDRIMEGRVATCLDLAMLFASCLEQAGLRPVILTKEGHAWVGVWLHQVCFSDPLIDDVQAVRKRVESGEFLVLETTGIAHHHLHRPSLRHAMEQGAAHLRETGTFRYAVDIHRARELQIKPLPSRNVQLLAEVAPTERPAAIETMPDLPPLDPTALGAIDLPQDDTPDGRLTKWKSRLLDLTLRNKLLNFKSNKSTLQIVAPDLSALEDCLADGVEFKLRPMPIIMEGQDPRDAAVHSSRTGRAPLNEMAAEAMANKELLTRLDAPALDASLLKIHTAAKTSLEEGGANTLFLAIGFLQWTDAEKSEVVHSAPILLIPVTLQRQSVKSGYRISRHDDDARVNPTLLQLLRTAFELNIPGVDPLPLDEHGIDVPKVLQAFRLAVRDITKWEVIEQAHLGIFSFTKYLMWKDLQDRTDALRANPVVRHLIDNPGQAFPSEESTDERERMDDRYRPQDILAPLLSDSSQLKAICAVDAGRNLVLEGPPGTGKSQTITNLIAHMLAKGKTVLFVSEKMAALSVVHRRLSALGLGPFCLELHSSKAKKTEVLQQLGQSLDIAGQRTASDWDREAKRLAELRSDLNGLVHALHKEHRSGLTVFDAIGTCIQHVGESPSFLPWQDAETHDRAAVDRLRETVRRMSAMAGALVRLDAHPLAAIGQTSWSPSWQDDLLVASQALDAAISKLRESVAPVARLLRLPPDGLSLETLAALDGLADLLLAAPKVPQGLARQAHDPGARSQVRSLATHGAARAAHWRNVGDGWTPQLAKLQAVELQATWTAAVNAWWPKAWFSQRSVATRLASCRTDGKRPERVQIETALRALPEVNEEDLTLRAMRAQAEALLEDSFAGLETDWATIEKHEIWARTFSDGVTRLAGVEPGRAETLRQLLQPLVSEQRALLAPASAIGRSLLEFRDAYREFRRAQQRVDESAQPVAPIAGPESADGALQRIQGVLSAWSGARRSLQPWCLWRSARDRSVAEGLQGVVASLESGAVPLASAPDHFEFSYRNWWLKKTFDTEPLLRGFSSADHERKINEFKQADASFQKLTEQYIAATLAGRVPSSTSAAVSADSEMGKLRRQLQMQRRQMPLRSLMQSLPTLLPRLKPCLLMSPLSVAQYLEAGHAPFDLVVFDEASQIPVWEAVGAIARGKQVVVVGDPKQLPPTNFFGRSTEGDSDDVGEEQVEDLESILDECLGAGMNRLSLQWHYRSKHESLITFSNVRYYDSQLVTFPSPVTDDVAVRFERVAGVYDRGGSRTNRAEAEATVNAIEAHFSTASNAKRSLGVVTFNQPQQDLINTLLDARRRTNTALDRAIAQATDEPLFVKNLENVQGDERDVIFFSIAYGPDASGKTTMNFGPLNGEGGHRRLNVAISRARESVVIFSTLMPEQIDLARVRAAGVRDLKNYLEFAIRGPSAILEQSLPTGREPDSPFEVAVLRMLRDRGWDIHPQVGCSDYRIDMAVVDPRAPGRYLVGIECDGRTYHSGATARDRDRLRQHVLESLGWRIHRIWSTDWWLNPDREIDKIDEWLRYLVEAGESSPPAPAGDSPSAPKSELGEESTALVPPPSGAPPIQVQPNVYRVCTLAAGDPDAFHEPGNAATLAMQIAEVVEVEGPVSEAVLFRRVARAWGLERTGSRIVERLRNAIPKSVITLQEEGRTFYSTPIFQATERSGFRIASGDDNSKRHVDEVSLIELGSLVLHVLDQGGATPRGEVARAVCRLIGMARMPSDAEMRMHRAVDELIVKKRLVEVDDLLRAIPT